jgi:hypothetical protein
MAETFVDTARFRGTCYRAANWAYLGETAGRTKRGNNYLHGGSKKALFVYPLRRDATRLLREGPESPSPGDAGAGCAACRTDTTLSR